MFLYMQVLRLMTFAHVSNHDKAALNCLQALKRTKADSEKESSGLIYMTYLAVRVYLMTDRADDAEAELLNLVTRYTSTSH